MGVKGYPTLKIVRPSKKAGARPSIEEYQGARSAKAIVDAVVERIPNHVTRVTDKSIGSWLKKSNETAKVILFTDKGTTSALLRALAIDFLGNIHVGQVHKKEAGAIETFGIKKYPTIVLLSGGDKEAVVYSGDIKKEPLSEFLSQIAEPNPDPAPEATKGQKAKSQKISQKKKKDETEKKPTKEAPVSALPAITDDATLREKCLSSSSKICALVLLPKIDAAQGEASAALIPRLRAIQDVHDKYARRKASFPIYLVQPDLALAATLRKELELQDDGHLEMVAINARRLWWRKYNSAEYSADSVEAWIDTIRMNEGKKEKLPESLLTTESTQEGAKDEGKKIGAKDKEEPVAKKIEHEEL
jgi:protein disulfide-isomerase A6